MNVITAIVVSIVKLVSKIHDKVTIVKTIIRRSMIIIRFSTIISILINKTQLTIIKNINIAVTIDF